MQRLYAARPAELDRVVSGTNSTTRDLHGVDGLAEFPLKDQPVLSLGATHVTVGMILGAMVVAIYGSTAVAVFDAFWPHVMGGTTSLNRKPVPA